MFDGHRQSQHPARRRQPGQALAAIEAVLEDLHQNVVRAYSGREGAARVLRTRNSPSSCSMSTCRHGRLRNRRLIRQRKNANTSPSSSSPPSTMTCTLPAAIRSARVDYITAPVVPEVLRDQGSRLRRAFREDRAGPETSRCTAPPRRAVAKARGGFHRDPQRPLDRKLLSTVTETAREIIGSRPLRPGSAERRALSLFVVTLEPDWPPTQGSRPARSLWP